MMNGKVVLITGAKGGLGTDVTQAFLDAGASVVGSSRSIRQSEFSSANFTAVAGDITQDKVARDLVAAVIDKFKRIEVLVHVMGGFTAGRIEETDNDTWERMLSLNLTSAFYVLRAVIPVMRQAGSGRIIGIGSRAAEEPHPGLGAYVASKSAMHILFRTAALENLDTGINVNVVLPGTMDTPSNRAAMPNADPSRWVKPADVAKLVVTLAGDHGAQINGALIPVYGKDF